MNSSDVGGFHSRQTDAGRRGPVVVDMDTGEVLRPTEPGACAGCPGTLYGEEDARRLAMRLMPMFPKVAPSILSWVCAARRRGMDLGQTEEVVCSQAKTEDARIRAEMRAERADMARAFSSGSGPRMADRAGVVDSGGIAIDPVPALQFSGNGQRCDEDLPSLEEIYAQISAAELQKREAEMKLAEAERGLEEARAEAAAYDAQTAAIVAEIDADTAAIAEEANAIEARMRRRHGGQVEAAPPRGDVGPGVVLVHVS